MRRPVHNDENAKVKLRLIEFEVEGGNSAIVESLRTMATALTRQKQPGPRALAAPSVGNGEKSEEPSPQGEIDFGLSDEASPEPIANAAEGSSRTTRPRAPRKAPVAPALIEIDIKTGKPPLAEFVQLVGSPESDWHRYLAIAYWLKRHYTPSVEAVTASHIYTCYRLLDWTAPNDVSMPLRDTTRKQQWFKKEVAGYVITLLGENEIQKTLKSK